MRTLLSLSVCCLTSSLGFAQDEAASQSVTDFQPNSMWVIDYTSNQISGYTIGGTLIRTISGIVSDPLGIAFGPNGLLYVSSSSGPHDILAINNLGSMGFFGNAELVSPRGLAFGPMGHLYVADYGANAIVEFDADHNYVRSITASGMSAPTAVAVGVDGHLFVASNGSGEILEIDPERGIVDSTSMDLVVDLAVDAQGNLWATRVTDGVYSLDDNGFSASEHYSGSQWSNSVCARIGPDYQKWVVLPDKIAVTSDGSAISRYVLDGAGFTNLAGIAFAPNCDRVKLKAKANGSTGAASNTEFVEVRFTPGTNQVSLLFTDAPSDATDIASWTSSTHSCFFGFGTFTSLSATQFQFRGTQQRLPARQSGADSIFVTLKGTVGTYGDFRMNKASGTLDLTYPNFLIHGTFK